jgi:8-oxo-dGTP diphosphatase
MKEIAFFNPENVTEDEVKTYRLREAARAVVLDDDYNVALLHVTSTDYYKLPGGGLDDDVDKIVTLKRECFEEIGCEIEVLQEIGLVNEWRKIYQIHQVSFCYLAKIVGKKGTPDFTESEIAERFEVRWLSSEVALKALTQSKAEHISVKGYMVPRDIAILRAAQQYLKN